MSKSIQRPVMTTFLALTPTSPRDTASPPSSRPSSLRSMSDGALPTPVFRERRGSSSSDTSVSDVGENGFLVLTSPERLLAGLRKIEEESVE